MELYEALNTRKSIRSYNGEQVTEEQLNNILKAAYEAPVGMGKYDSIHFTVITNKDVIDEIDRNAAETFGAPSFHPLYGAPALIVISSNNDDNVASANVGIIIQNMSLAAVAEGVGQCAIYGATNALAQNKALVSKIGVPEGFKPLGSIILGGTDEKYESREIPEGHKYEMNVIK